MFNKEYNFKGTHAKKAFALTSNFDENAKISVFKRNFDLYLLAPIVGFLFNEKCKENDEGNLNRDVYIGAIHDNKDELMLNYRIIMLLDKKHEPDLNKRIDKAFRLFGTDSAKPDEELYNQYVLGGVDILHKKIMEQDSDDYIKNLFEFLEEFNDMFNEKIDMNDIMTLCRNVES